MPTQVDAAIYTRPIKIGGNQNYVDEVASGYPELPAKELDDDLNVLYTGVNDLWSAVTGNLISQIPDGSIPASKIVPLSITADQIADNSITDQKIVTLSWSKITGAPTPFPEAPSDGKLYGRQSNAWTVVPSGATGGIPEAPTDGQMYGRKSSAWAVVTGGSPWTDTGTALQPVKGVSYPLSVGSITLPITTEVAFGPGAALPVKDAVLGTVRYAAGTQTGASIVAAADQNWTGTGHSTRLMFSVGAATTFVEAFRINGSANAYFGPNTRVRIGDFTIGPRDTLDLLGGVILGPSQALSSPSDGTLHFTGSKFQGRVGGAWIDMPAGSSGFTGIGPTAAPSIWSDPVQKSFVSVTNGYVLDGRTTPLINGKTYRLTVSGDFAKVAGMSAVLIYTIGGVQVLQTTPGILNFTGSASFCTVIMFTMQSDRTMRLMVQHTVFQGAQASYATATVSLMTKSVVATGDGLSVQFSADTPDPGNNVHTQVVMLEQI